MSWERFNKCKRGPSGALFVTVTRGWRKLWLSGMVVDGAGFKDKDMIALFYDEDADLILVSSLAEHQGDNKVSIAKIGGQVSIGGLAAHYNLLARFSDKQRYRVTVAPHEVIVYLKSPQGRRAK